MARKKELTYNDVIRNIAEMEKLAEVKRRRMASNMALAMDDRTAELLGDLNDTDLQRVARLMYGYAGECKERVLAEKARRDEERKLKKAMEAQDGARTLPGA